MVIHIKSKLPDIISNYLQYLKLIAVFIFQRSIRRNRQYVCKAKTEGSCLVDKTHRNQCRACRLKRCADVGMNKDAVQHERGPRNSTLRRQMSLYFKEQQHHPLSISQQLIASSDVTPPPAAHNNLSAINGTNGSSTGSTPKSIHAAGSVSSRINTSSASPPSSKDILDSKPSPSPSAFHHHLSMLAANESAMAAVANRHPLFVPSSIPSMLPLPGGFPNTIMPSTSPKPFPSSTPPVSSSPLSITGGSILAPLAKYPHEVTPPSPPQTNITPPILPFPFNPHSQTLLSNPAVPPYANTASPMIPPFSAMALATAASLRHMNTENLSETAARLLFMNVRWAQHVPAFTSLPYRDQLLLLEESWRELFILSAAQFSLPVEAAALQISPSNSDTPSLISTLSDLKNFQDAIAKFQNMNVDATEFACLRAIILLKTCIEAGGDDHKEVRDQAAISALQDQAQLTLSKYISSAYPSQPSRFGKLLLLLPSLKTVTGKSIEELFFKKTIGTIPIERIICDMYKNGAI